MTRADLKKIRGLLLNWRNGEISFLGIMKALEEMEDD